MTAGNVATEEKLFDDVKAVKSFSNSGNRLNTGCGSEAAVPARTRIGWVKFRGCGEMFFGNRFLLRIKEKVY